MDHCEEQNPTSNTLTTPLHIAAKYSNLEILQYLVDIGVKLDIQDIDGWTPLHLSAMAKVQYWPGLPKYSREHINESKVLDDLLTGFYAR